MATLKEISATFPGNYTIIDSKERRGEILSWNDIIEIVYKGKSHFFTRRGAYRKGLASKPKN